MGKSLISNPPYNMKWELPVFAQMQLRFMDYELPPESNSNYAFILTALNWIDNKAALLLPNGVLSSDNRQEKSIREQLVKNNLLDAVITLPDKMFVSTTIPTCILLFDKHKKTNTVEMIDLRRSFEEEQRDQNGQFGGNSHEKRTYHKTFKILSDETINKAVKCIDERKNIPSLCRAVCLNEIERNDYNIIPSRYIEFVQKEDVHRSFEDIAKDINYIARMQNACKLVINETIAKNIGFDIEKFKESKNISKETQQMMKTLGIDLAAEDYIQFTKVKNEFCFKCNDKEILPEILLQFLPIWKNQIALLNTMQNQYLTELREALLPDLMAGKIEV
ncbi:MAG: N-6 DNA methylase [Ruminococcus sp.]|nr:N-6 DNA methylase [Ruminococcus sp.]